MADVSVRPSVPAEAPELARIQAAVWTQVHRDSLPADLLEAVASAQAAEQWRDAVAAPPSPRHRVMTALAGGTVVGFAAVVPAADPDLDPAVDAELSALYVDPQATGAGHGSRLVNAAVDLARDAGFTTVQVWTTEAERDLRGFLGGAGWAPDGATRELDLRGDGEVLVTQTRLAASLSEL